MEAITKQIQDLLTDDSFPSMIQLDGNWGSGKTHYVETSLKGKLTSLYEKKNIIYFSVFGLTSLADFRDKLISSSYLSDKVDTHLLDKLKDSAFGIFSALGSESTSTLGKLINTSSGAIKHAMIAKLDNLIILLDDLERLSDEALKENIIGECLHLAEEKDISFIFILNSSELKIKNTLLEKAFAGKIKFRYTTKELFTIAFNEKYKNLIPHKKSIISLIDKYELNNLRVLQRVSFKLNQIYLQIKDIKDIDMETTIELFTKDLIRIACLHYCHNESPEQIFNELKVSSLSQAVKEQLAVSR
ncbi:MAG: P-loop NTPase fold protein [Thalassotalea sp.]